jgi:hypothetical protein
MNRSARWMGAAAVTAGLLLAGSGTAFADASPTTDHSTSAVCAHRLPAALARIDKVTARINGDAGTRGSTAWLTAKADQARQAGFGALADLLDARVASRPDRLVELAELRGDVQDVQAEDCA